MKLAPLGWILLAHLLMFKSSLFSFPLPHPVSSFPCCIYRSNTVFTCRYHAHQVVPGDHWTWSCNASKAPPLPLVEHIVTYNGECVPSLLLNKTIQGCFVEILDYGEINLLEDDDSEYKQKIKNHVCLETFFFTGKSLKAPSTLQEEQVVSGLPSILLAQLQEPALIKKVEIFKWGSLLVRSNVSLSAVEVFGLQLGRSSLTLYRFARPPITKQMTNSFIFNGHGYMGCRDWMWVHQLFFAVYVHGFC